MDRRLTPATDTTAHDSLRGKLDRPIWTKGEEMQLAVPLADLCAAPGGARDRQLLWGDSFCLIERRGGHGFGFARKDGYCGWLALDQLAAARPVSHWVASPGTHLYPAPKVQAPELAPLHMGARLAVVASEGAWARLEGGQHVPAAHLRAIGDWLEDPVTIAESLLGTPYLWGGNSRAGIDCSGLVQAALLACGIDCPADSDQQARIGTQALGPPRRGDLWFWRGHVALVVDDRRLIHANAHAMAVAHEGLEDCAQRILRSGGGEVVARRRLQMSAAAAD